MIDTDCARTSGGEAISPRLTSICNRCGVELIAWTVDDEARLRKLVEMGVDGLVSNDPRLYRSLPTGSG